MNGKVPRDDQDAPFEGAIRRRLLFSGRVQGVGFRYTTTRLAQRFDVTGYVRNLSDGRVEAVMEGVAGHIDGLQQAIADEMRGCIRDVSAQNAPATGEFAGFDVRF